MIIYTQAMSSVAMTSVRAAVVTDTVQLARLFREFITFNLDYLSGLPKQLLTIDDASEFAVATINSYFDQNLLMFVAEEHDEIVGYICGEIKNEFHLAYMPEAEIIDWFVTESKRSAGIGKALYAAFVHAIKANNCKVLSVEAFVQNHNARETYRTMGFIEDSIILKKLI